MGKNTHKIVLQPGQTIEIRLTQILENGYPDEVGLVTVLWQDRDAPVGQVASKHRELQVDLHTERGKVGPTITRNLS